MAEVRVLVEGYARRRAGRFTASSSAVLLEDSGRRVLADPGCEEKLLLRALEREGLSPRDIDLVFLTHCHLDHLLNIRLFRGVDVADGKTVYSGDEETALRGRIPGTRIEIAAAPGHSRDHAALLAETGGGVVAVAGDLWWWEDGMRQAAGRRLLSVADPLAEDRKALKASRKMVLSKADFVVPGHGKAFAVGRGI
jgi:glyoxylase-like metal-dependent hydrolase (beta-lactamase superfamily II)